MPILQVENLRTHYFTDEGLVQAADGVSFTLEKGESIGIAGESGCGKTTVAMSLMRLIEGGAVVGGKVILEGLSLLDMPMNCCQEISSMNASILILNPITAAME